MTKDFLISNYGSEINPGRGIWFWRGVEFTPADTVTVTGLFGGHTGSPAWVALYESDGSRTATSLLASASVTDDRRAFHSIDDTTIEEGNNYILAQGSENSGNGHYRADLGDISQDRLISDYTGVLRWGSGDTSRPIDSQGGSRSSNEMPDIGIRYDSITTRPTEPEALLKLTVDGSIEELPFYSINDVQNDELRAHIGGDTLAADLVPPSRVDRSDMRVHTPQNGTMAWREERKEVIRQTINVKTDSVSNDGSSNHYWRGYTFTLNKSITIRRLIGSHTGGTYNVALYRWNSGDNPEEVLTSGTIGSGRFVATSVSNVTLQPGERYLIAQARESSGSHKEVTQLNPSEIVSKYSVIESWGPRSGNSWRWTDNGSPTVPLSESFSGESSARPHLGFDFK